MCVKNLQEKYYEKVTSKLSRNYIFPPQAWSIRLANTRDNPGDVSLNIQITVKHFVLFFSGQFLNNAS